MHKKVSESSLKATSKRTSFSLWKRLLHADVDEEDVEKLMADLFGNRDKRQAAREGYRASPHDIIADVYGIGVVLAQNPDATRLFLRSSKHLDNGPDLPKSLEESELVAFVVKLGFWGTSRSAKKRADKISGVAEMLAVQNVTPSSVPEILKAYTIEGLAARVARWHKLDALGHITTRTEFEEQQRSSFEATDLPPEEGQTPPKPRNLPKPPAEKAEVFTEAAGAPEREQRAISFNSEQLEFLDKSIGRRVGISVFVDEDGIICTSIKGLQRRPP